MIENTIYKDTDVASLITSWSKAFSNETTEEICSYYDEQAFLWGTLSSIKRDDKSLIKAYFDNLFQYQQRSVELTNLSVRFFGDVAISNGTYIFKWFTGEKIVAINARFTFVCIYKQENWVIVEHHSSVFPTSE